MIKVITLKKQEEIQNEINSIKKSIELRKSFFANDKPYCQKIDDLWNRVIRVEKKLRRQEHA